MVVRDDIRDWVLIEGRSQRAAAKYFGVSRDTVAALLREPTEIGERPSVFNIRCYDWETRGWARLGSNQ